MIWLASWRPGAIYRSAGGRRIGGSSAQSPITVRSSRDGFYGQPEGDLMIKIMLLLHRRPDLSVEEFRRHWHTEHQALLVSLPGLRRLVLNDVLPGLDGAPGPCDGIAEDWWTALRRCRRRSRRSRVKPWPRTPRTSSIRHGSRSWL